MRPNQTKPALAGSTGASGAWLAPGSLWGPADMAALANNWPWFFSGRVSHQVHWAQTAETGLGCPDICSLGYLQPRYSVPMRWKAATLTGH